MLVYVAGPYRGDVDENIAHARKVAIELWEIGHAVICPHLNTAHMEEDCSLLDEDYLAGDIAIMARCDCVVMVKGWELSVGARAEREYAMNLDMPVYFEPDYPQLHPTELTRPLQCEAFIETVMQMYRTHLAKNADYSPANIAGAGEVGLMTRTWDKVARLMNLMGFHIEVSSMRFEHGKTPKCEALEDSIMDMAVYGVIWKIFRRGLWGK